VVAGATPQVAGAAADVRNGNRSWTAARRQADLRRTAVDLDTPGQDDVVKVGRVTATGDPADVPTTDRHNMATDRHNIMVTAQHHGDGRPQQAVPETGPGDGAGDSPGDIPDHAACHLRSR
jgi:hypothetical protein